MALVQDPGFWKRFSTAAHLDEEEKLSNASNSPNGRPNLKHSKSWLDRQKKKRARRTIVCWVFWIIFTAVVTGVVIAVLLLKAKGVIGGHNDKAAADENAGSYAVGGSGP